MTAVEATSVTEEEQSKPLALRIGAELVGSFIICFAIYSICTLGSAIYGVNMAFIALLTGLVYAAATLIFGTISGAQFNPAVSVAAMLSAPAPGERLAFSTDSFVVTPHFFPGGDIGRLAVCGTVNDVATSGAVPRYLSCGFVLEEGFPIEDLKRICASMAECAQEAGVHLVTGDKIGRAHV